jgi:hypothetical protein
MDSFRLANSCSRFSDSSAVSVARPARSGAKRVFRFFDFAMAHLCS